MTIHTFAAPHQEARAASYPAIGDQLDAVFKLAAHLAGQEGAVLPEAVTAWIGAVQAVKDAFPKAAPKTAPEVTASPADAPAPGVEEGGV